MTSSLAESIDRFTAVIESILNLAGPNVIETVEELHQLPESTLILGNGCYEPHQKLLQAYITSENNPWIDLGAPIDQDIVDARDIPLPAIVLHKFH